MKIVAFTGKKGTGKSTACAYLEEKYGFTRVNFKDALIAELKENFPDLLGAIQSAETYLDESLCEFVGPTMEELFGWKPPLIRTLMQNYGTNVRRKDDPDYWVKQWQKALAVFHEQWGAGITVDDCRFLNEAEAVKRAGGIIVRLVRTDMVHTDTHESEMQMDSIVPDFTIVCNGGDYEHLHKELDAIMAK